MQTWARGTAPGQPAKARQAKWREEDPTRLKYTQDLKPLGDWPLQGGDNPPIPHEGHGPGLRGVVYLAHGEH